MAKVSVIIPCYNAQDYIVNCLEALAKQTFKDFDVFCVDDCSSDYTEAVIKEYQKASHLEIHYLRNETNSGPAYSRNHAIEHSSADYICFCDSDDWYDVDYLECMVAEASKNDADMVFCDYRMVWDSGKTMNHHTEINAEHLAHSESVLPRSTDSLCAMMVRRSIIAHVPQPNLRNGEDMAVIPLLVVNSKQFGKVDKCIYNYLCREDSVSNDASMKVVESLLLSFNHIKGHMPNGYENEVEFIGIRNLIYGALLILFKCGYNKNHASRILTDFTETFPKWRSNNLIHLLPFSKRVFIFFAAKRMFIALWLLSRVHNMVVKIG